MLLATPDTLEFVEKPARTSLEFVGSTAAYWFSDGLPELAFGLALVAVGATGLAWEIYFPFWWMQTVFGVAIIGFFGLFVWHRRILSAVKMQLTYPRLGCATPPQDGHAEGKHILTLLTEQRPDANRNVTTFGMEVAYIIFSSSMLLRFFAYQWSVSVVVFAIACFIYFRRRWSEYPYSWLSMLPLALAGIPFSLANVPARAQTLMPIFLGGLWLFCRGGCRLVSYLRANPSH